MNPLANISVQFVKGVGPARAKLFSNLGIENIEDLLYFFPRRYEDRRNITPIKQLKLGEWQTVTGKILNFDARRSWFTKKHVTEIFIDDGTGRIACVWFNQPYLNRYFKPDKKIVCYGKLDLYKNRLQMVSPEYEVIESEEDDSLSLNRIVPLYPLTRGMTHRFLRKVVRACLDKFKNQISDELPVSLRNKLRLPNIKRCIEEIHYPPDDKAQEESMRRISFEEFYFFQVAIMLRRQSITQKKGVSHKIGDISILNFINGFPFTLTQAQKKVIREIREDMQKETPMLRLLQGDVGCGKTLVALFGCLAAFENGCQSALMAPTEILARQHYDNIVNLIENGPLKGMRAALLISGLKKKDKDELYQKIAGGDIDLVIGTHALLSESVVFKNLSYVVIDEQHKFGVRQRALLTEKGKNPDVLIMTATPIPRTLCITLYGDLDISIIDEIPPGRGKIETRLFDDEKSSEVYDLVKSKLKEGRQAYIVYPIIEESEQTDLKAAEQMYKKFKKDEFKDYCVGLIHGRLKEEETESLMQRFKNKEIDVLVSTTVLEVGVDVPNATVMVIEHAERFGLSQLHQLRGRIGRGEYASECLLIADVATPEAQHRLKAILSTTDGFEIAKQDLLLRGPGHYFGRHQHGLNELKVANPATQLDILELARNEALELMREDAKLEKEEHRMIRQIVQRRYPTYLAMAKAG
ncbi:MAG: ATP-dependent DNA helicase RecG [Candidatus Omnitrophica bacterium]|nr:ATP-dependent DNA helicase RecG [Candidatus Omnitrophota bacterium]